MESHRLPWSSLTFKNLSKPKWIPPRDITSSNNVYDLWVTVYSLKLVILGVVLLCNRHNWFWKIFQPLRPCEPPNNKGNILQKQFLSVFEQHLFSNYASSLFHSAECILLLSLLFWQKESNNIIKGHILKSHLIAAIKQFDFIFVRQRPLILW